jgi:FixJ family two-component response regulator
MIAVVDDDEGVREGTKTLLRSMGYSASTFGAAEEFLKSKQFSNTSCVITDLQMPELSGLDLQDLLIARGHRIPIIFITAYPDENARTRAMNAGAVAFLSKPVNHDQLLGYLDKALKVH